MTKPNNIDPLTSLDDVLSSFFELDLDAVKDSWGKNAGVFRLKSAIQQLMVRERQAEVRNAYEVMMGCDGFVGDAYQPLMTYLEDRQALLSKLTQSKEN